MAAEHRIASVTKKATRLQVSENVRKREFTATALNAKLQLADRTNHQPSTTRLFPCRRFAAFLAARQWSIKRPAVIWNKVLCKEPY
jgi:hypothetical protein